MSDVTKIEERLGAHVSVEGGVHTAPGRGLEIGASAIQVFTKGPSQWREPVLENIACEAFTEACSTTGLRCIVAHDSYLINLASPDHALNERSVEAFARELARGLVREWC